MRYWTQPPITLAQTADDLDLIALEPDLGWVELADEAAYNAAAAAIAAAHPSVPRIPIVTALQGNNQTYTTAANARRVTITVIAPVGGNTQARPMVDGKRIAASPGGYPYVFDRPGPLKIDTKAGNNDIVVVEEF